MRREGFKLYPGGREWDWQDPPARRPKITSRSSSFILTGPKVSGMPGRLFWRVRVKRRSGGRSELDARQSSAAAVARSPAARREPRLTARMGW
jgi:hypothetical protein